MNPTEQQIANFLAPFNPQIASLAQQLRAWLKAETQPATELVGDSTISVDIGYGFTEKAWDCFGAIIVYSKHINLSFPSGASLADPEGLLQGKGKRIRHIRIGEINDIQAPAVQNLLHEARQLALGGEKAAPPLPVQTLIKPIAGVKKRPH